MSARDTYCSCCKTMVSRSTARRHRNGEAPMLTKVAAASTSHFYKDRLRKSAAKRKSVSKISNPAVSGHLEEQPMYQQLPASQSVPSGYPAMTSAQLSTQVGGPSCRQDTPDIEMADTGRDLAMDLDTSHVSQPAQTAATTAEGLRHGCDINEHVAEAAISSLQGRIWSGRTRQATVEDAEDDGDAEDGAEDVDALQEETGGWSFDEEGGDPIYDAISSWDRIHEHFLRGITKSPTLTPEDLQYLRPFALKVDTHMPGAAFSKLPYAFPESQVPSWKVCQQKVADLSGFEPQVYDCCVNSCCLFVGTLAAETTCPYCHTSRYDTNNKRRREFVYLPIIPRLKQFLANEDMARKMRYRASEHVHDPDVIKDVFDSDVYRSLQDRNVVVDGQQLQHTFFDDDRDIALGLSTDGFAPFRRRKQTCWPLILFNYNLPPEIRFHMKNVLSLGVIPGPKKPVDFDSFLWPCVQELLRLEVGVHAYDSLSDDFFALRAYLILVFGDIPAISMVMRMKGHNGLCPCRMCEIRGVRVPNTRQPTHYVPLDRSLHPDVTPPGIQTYDPLDLPLRNHDQFLSQARAVQFAATETESGRLAKESGIKGVPVLSVLTSLTFPSSFPYDFMHLIWENVVKNLMCLWGDDYKGLNTGTEEYRLTPTLWEAIGAATADSGPTIPAAYGPRPPNIAKDKTSWTAESRSFWFLFVGPVVLEGRFMNRKYYDHFVDLVRLINMCLQFEISRTEVATVRHGFAAWVQKYETYYYQRNPSRLSACPLTIHALLHIADSITAAGPVWTSWAFPMERYCGSLQPAIRSRRFPYASLNRYVLDHARLSGIKLKYGASEELALGPSRLDGYYGGRCVQKYDCCVLLPSFRTRTFERGISDKIIAALCTRFQQRGVTRTAIKRALPSTVTECARIRLAPDGDTIRAAAYKQESEATFESEDGRNASFIRYEQLVDKNTRFRHLPEVLEIKTFYGQLLHVVTVDFAGIPTAQIPAQTLVLAVIRSCAIEAVHPTLDIHYYSKDGALEVVDISLVKCLVGRIKDRNRWAVIDRSGSLSRGLYLEDE